MATALGRLIIRIYQLTLSSLVGRQCRYLPTCSDYADEAIARHGLWAGGWMGIARLSRCHPWGGAGYDPVPDVCAPGCAHKPWRYGRWRPPAEPDAQERASSSAASP